MDWYFQRYNKLAVETATGLRFRVNNASDGEVFAPESLKVEHLDAVGQRRLKLDGVSICHHIFEAVAEARRRDDMRCMVNKYFRKSCINTAELIQKNSGKRLSQRTIQCWLIDASKPSSRSCPEWAVKILREYIATLPREQDVDELPTIQRSREIEIYDNKSVEWATDRIEIDRARDARWADAPIGDYPKLISDFQGKTLERLDTQIAMLYCIIRSIKNASSIEDIRNSLGSELERLTDINHVVNETRRDIEGRVGEFGNPEGIIAKD